MVLEGTIVEQSIIDIAMTFHAELQRSPNPTFVHMMQPDAPIVATERGGRSTHPLNFWCFQVSKVCPNMTMLTIGVTDDHDAQRFYEIGQQHPRGFQMTEDFNWTLWDYIPDMKSLRVLNIGIVTINPQVLLEHIRYLQGETRRVQLGNNPNTLRNRTENVYPIELDLEGFGLRDENAFFLSDNLCADQTCAQTQRNLWRRHQQVLRATWDRDQRAFNRDIERNGGQLTAYRVQSPRFQPELTCNKDHFSFTFAFDSWDDELEDNDSLLAFGLIQVRLKALRTE